MFYKEVNDYFDNFIFILGVYYFLIDIWRVLYIFFRVDLSRNVMVGYLELLLIIFLRGWMFLCLFF